MQSVARIARTAKQPRGGYINPKLLASETFDDGIVLHEVENVHASIVGMAVDYLTRCQRGMEVEKAFHISWEGAWRVNDEDVADELIGQVKGLDDASIASVCKLAGYDVVYRAGAQFFTGIDDIDPDPATCANVRVMVQRSVDFLESHGPVIFSGLGFPAHVAPKVDSSDLDYVTAKGLWEFKVSKLPPKKEHTLQVLLYHLLGLAAGFPEFQTLETLGIYNPRTDEAHTIRIEDIDLAVIEAVKHDLMGL